MTQSKKVLKILIVDDSPAVADILFQLCELLGHEVLVARDGAEGLTFLHQGHEIDIVFTDFKLPKLNGVEMTERIKTEYPNVPVVLITGSVMVQHTEFESAGFDAVIHKPFEFQTIVDTIDRFFPAH